MLAANVCTARFLEQHDHPGALSRARGTDAGKARGAPRFPRELRAVAPGRRRPDGVGLCEAPAPNQGPSRLRAAADGAAALAAAGALSPRQRRTLRPFLRGVCALHLADPPLSRPARPSRDQGGAREDAVSPLGRELGRARQALLVHRAARRRRDARRRELAQVLFHAGQGRRDVRRHDQRRHELRHLRHAGQPQHRRPRPRHRARARLFPFRRRPARDDRRAQRPRVPARRPRPRQGRARRPRDDQDRLHARRRSASPNRRRGASTASRSPARRRQGSRKRQVDQRCSAAWRLSRQIRKLASSEHLCVQRSKIRRPLRKMGELPRASRRCPKVASASPCTSAPPSPRPPPR